LTASFYLLYPWFLAASLCADVAVYRQIGTKNDEGIKFPSAGDACEDKFLVESVLQSQVQNPALWDARNDKSSGWVSETKPAACLSLS
jgi:hypothetical protein